MARPLTEFRNEMKTRVPDRTYEAVRLFMEVKGIESESRAIAKLLELICFGTAGTIPTALLGSSHHSAISGPKTQNQESAQKIMHINLAAEVEADLALRAADFGCAASEYLEILVLTGAYGYLHPSVVSFWDRYKARISGPETQKAA